MSKEIIIEQKLNGEIITTIDGIVVEYLPSKFLKEGMTIIKNFYVSFDEASIRYGWFITQKEELPNFEKEKEIDEDQEYERQKDLNEEGLLK